MTKEEFDNKLKTIGMTRQTFADITKLSYGAVSNWQDHKKPVPGWVESWIDNYIKAKFGEDVINAIKPLIERQEENK